MSTAFKNKLCLGIAWILSGATMAQNAVFQTFPPAVNGTVQVCANAQIVFINASTGVLPGASYSWSFGTGASPASSTTSENSSVVYGVPTTGTTATLTINNNTGGPSSSYSVTIVVLDSPESNLTLGTADPAFSVITTAEGTAFAYCAGSGPVEFDFISNYPSLTSQSFGWGDGTSPASQVSMTGNSIAHTYDPGQHTITHTVVSDNGCSATGTYTVFNGSAPVITISGAGATSCIPSPYPITILSNEVLIDYLVTFSDGTPPLEFTTESDTTISHSFPGTSCGVDYVYAPGLPPIPNAFSASIVASNLCSSGGLPTVFTIGPLSVSEPTQATILPSSGIPICEGETNSYTDISYSGIEVSSAGCSDDYTHWWTIQPAVGFSVTNGSLGNSSSSGSPEIELEFTTPGTFSIWLYTSNNCGTDSTVVQTTVLPTASIASNPSTQTLCTGDLSAPISFVSSVPGYLVNWEVISMDNVSTDGNLSGSGVSSAVVPSTAWSLTGSGPGVVIIEAALGCSNEIPAVCTLYVAPSVAPVVLPLASTICSGSSPSIPLSSSDLNATFSWTVESDSLLVGAANGSGTSINQTLSNASTAPVEATYTVSIGNVTCPGNPVEVTVSVLPAVVLPDLNDLEVCPGDPIGPSDPAPAIEGISYNWDTGLGITGLTGQGSGWAPTWVAASNNTGSPISDVITVTGQVANCPSKSTDFVVIVNPLIQPIATPASSEICTGTSTSISIGPTVPGAVYSWTANAPINIAGETNGTGNSVQQILTNSGNSPLSVTYSISVNGVACPGAPGQAVVTVYPILVLPALADVIACPGDVIQPTTGPPSITGANFNFIVDVNNLGLPVSGEGWVPFWSAPANTSGTDISGTITVFGQVANCPEVSESFEVIVHPSPTFTASVTPNGGLDCVTATAQIFALADPINCSFSWTGSGIVSGSTSSNPTVNAAGTYAVTLIDPTTGCSNTGNVVVGPANTISIANAEVVNAACADESSGFIDLTITGPGPHTFVWDPPVSNSSIADNLPEGTYSVEISNPFGCETAGIFEVTEPEPVEVFLIDTAFSECGESNGFIQVLAIGGTGNFNYLWNNGDTGPVLTGIDAGNYAVQVTDAQGCAESLQHTLDCIELIPPRPNTFISPNGDALNPVWFIENIELYSENEVSVFNRWGNLVHRASPYTNAEPWNGTYTEGRDTGKPLPSATYYFIIETKKKTIGTVEGFIEIQISE